jgi:hypothetical protein
LSRARGGSPLLAHTGFGAATHNPAAPAAAIERAVSALFDASVGASVERAP